MKRSHFHNDISSLTLAPNKVCFRRQGMCRLAPSCVCGKRRIADVPIPLASTALFASKQRNTLLACQDNIFDQTLTELRQLLR
ncbi:hypothetical protein, partial [Burkholderia sp. LMG 13014]|uniref:hypothetical protein n=1 Tax=Burkholderia sp. LMG 13014 TaxID=2709306 RepID=UPI001962DE4A